MTSKSKPVHRHLRKQFEEELERVAPGLWERAGRVEKQMCLSEMRWVNEVVAVLGRGEAEHLREVIFQQYRRHEDPLRRRWSSLFSHHEIMKKDRMAKGGESTHNCPLVATLKMFYSSAFSVNKKAEGEAGSGGEDGSSSDEDEY